MKGCSFFGPPFVLHIKLLKLQYNYSYVIIKHIRLTAVTSTSSRSDWVAFCPHHKCHPRHTRCCHQWILPTQSNSACYNQFINHNIFGFGFAILCALFDFVVPSYVTFFNSYCVYKLSVYIIRVF